mmetsp:Transcript_55151/g.83451  ORF Transcript_55151/g.83451 Transcript_55151/m.83451 type:complete len:88 (+) Transcript_55151:895-1158(+)
MTKYKNIDEAIDIANDSDYGLGGIIFGENRSLAEEISGKLDTGMVFTNTFSRSDPRMPFGGIKNSGYGREGGKFGTCFANVKTVWIE